MPNFIKRISIRFVLGFLAVYLGLGLISYGMAWRQFSHTPGWVLGTGGRNVTGRISDLRTSGFGRSKNYFVKIEDGAETYMISGLIANPDGIEPRYSPVDLDKYIQEGAKITIITSGGSLPVVLLLVANDAPGGAQEVLSYQASSKRFAEIVGRSAGWGTLDILLGILLIIGFFVADSAIRKAGGIRKFLPSSFQAKKTR